MIQCAGICDEKRNGVNYLLLLLSVVSETVKNAYTNHFSKRIAKTNADTYLFNAVLSLGGVLFFLFTREPFAISRFSAVVALIFAVVTIFAQVFLTLAMGCGPMSFSILFTYLGTMIIPTVYGMLFLDQTPSVTQLVGFALMLVSVGLSVDLKQKGEHAMSMKWLLLTLGGFIMWGLVGVCQQIHQSSDYAGEINAFLLWSFVMMAAILLVFFAVCKKRGEVQNYHVKSKDSVFVLLSGVATGAINLINLFLAGVMPGIIFFPIVSGGVIILSGMAAIVVFKEWLDKKQVAGVVIGVISVILLGI